ncbi:hypothetical protein [Janthinobacterium sp. BJB401]|uniref:hypothetical protein n=1 Tax=Janthinobacterium sp. BJB401 TaxID=2745934 RepID=UPI00159542C6|nr:hypothetical protein [Janthinobacterium sp. BJB401]NVI83189.1 hypothetical protein [Janthinobacterium sp. BJB401]
MKKFEIPGYIFDFIDGLLLVNGEIALSKKIPANDFINSIINTFQTKPTTTGAGLYIFDINGWVGDYVVELIIVKENFPEIDYIIMHYFENNPVGNGVRESSLVKQIQRKSGIPGKMKGLSEIAFQFSWGSVIAQHDIKISSSCIILQYKIARKSPIRLKMNDHCVSHINIDKSVEVQQRILASIKNSDTFFPKASEIRWLNLLKKLPRKLKICLINEISFENTLIALHSSGWPDEGSVVALLSNRFRTKEFDKDLHFRALNDAHYCKEEISYFEDNVTHLMIN